MSKLVKKIGKGIKKAVKTTKRFVKKHGKTVLGAAALGFGGAGLMGYGPLGSSLGGYGSSIGKFFSGGGSTGSLGASLHGGAQFGGGGGLGGFGNLAMAGIDAYGSYQSGKQSAEDYRKAFETANPFAAHRGKYAARLNKLYSDPSSVEDIPGYKFQMEQGTKAIGRSAAARGGRLGGGVMQELQKYGQGLASQYRQQEIQNLSMLSGATMGFGGGQYGAGAGQQEWGGIQEAAGTIGHALGYGGGDKPTLPIGSQYTR
jgi:hypothetical protein